MILAPLLSLSLLAAPQAEPPKPEMTTYQMVLFKRGPHAEETPREEREHLDGVHAAYLEQLSSDGTAVILGAITTPGDLREVVVLDAKSTEAARSLFLDDALVKRGVLVPEVHPWFAQKDLLRRPDDVTETTPCYLGLLVTGEKANEPAADAAAIQEGHMANIRKMAKSGDLAIAGPFGDKGAIRGILIFRTADKPRIESLVAEDPAVKAGRLKLELYAWAVPKGTLPDWKSGANDEKRPGG